MSDPQSIIVAELAALRAENARLADQNWKLTLALLERPIPADCPPETFPSEPSPHIDPPPHHPDHDEHHIMIAALSLDPGLRQ